MNGPEVRKVDRGPAFAWMHAPHVARTLAALEAQAPGEARFVGGCVRDSLIGRAPHDIDIATTLEPRAVIEALHAAGLGAAPTGIAHGTVTATDGGCGVEITTLRADVETDGRRAIVAFTKDWAQDAMRRDFTINALYLSGDGTLFDIVGGERDLRAGRVRFIGDPHARIREDFLRILRFFRFSARFASTYDDDGLAACAALKSGIATLSAERVGAEISALLAHKGAANAVAKMLETGVLAEIWSAPPMIDRLRALKRACASAGAPLGLAALFGDAGEGIDARLRLSNADRARRIRALSNAPRVERLADERAARALYYRIGAEAFDDAALLVAACGRPSTFADIGARWRAPVFDLKGRDAIALGASPGPIVAAALAAAEERWIGEDFPDRERARALLSEEVARLTSKG